MWAAVKLDDAGLLQSPQRPTPTTVHPARLVRAGVPSRLEPAVTTATEAPRVGWQARLLVMAATGGMPAADALRWVPLATEHDLERIARAWADGHHAQAWTIARDVAVLGVGHRPGHPRQ